ncbi:MAG: DUF202 domain-containing protein [Qingshengfaniella sp.]
MIVNYADHSANERTFLAWVRTVIAIEGFGIGAARLGPGAAALWTEVMMLVAGGVVVLLAHLRMRRLRLRIDRAERFDDEGKPADAMLLLVIAALFALIGSFALHVS